MFTYTTRRLLWKNKFSLKDANFLYLVFVTCIYTFVDSLVHKHFYVFMNLAMYIHISDILHYNLYLISHIKQYVCIF